MAELDWHKDRADNSALALLDSSAPPGVDLSRVRQYRLGRVRAEMAKQGISVCLLFDPVNVRYATDARNMQVFHLRNPSRYLFLPVEGPVIIFEFTGAGHLAEGLETIDEVRPATTASFVAAGSDIAAIEKQWAAEMSALIREHFEPGVRVGVERVNARAAMALGDEGFDIVDAQQPVEMARAIKSAEELELIKASLRATERGVQSLRDRLRPGITENQLWSVLHAAVIAEGGDYIETRLLTSGPHTNPWFQEAGDRVIQPNELVALDTDVVGCYGYYSDFSRTFHSGPGSPTARQQELYRTSYEQLHHNMSIIEAGMTFSEYADKAWDIPERFVPNRYYLSAHGVGMTGEYPYLYHSMDYPESGYDGVIEPMMTLCVESYIGLEGGREGVKLEEQILVTESGVELLSDFPFEPDLLGENVVPLHAGPHKASPRLGPTPRSELVAEITRIVLSELAAERDPCGGSGACAARVPAEVGRLIDAGATRVTFRGDDSELADLGLCLHLEYALIDADVTAEDVDHACDTAISRGFAAVCVNPVWVRRAAGRLLGSDVTVVAAVGYPLGVGTVPVTVQESRQALRNGASEIDLAINVGSVKSGGLDEVEEMISKVSEACREKDARLKVVIEADLLTDEQKALAIDAVVRGRGDYVKVASGFQGTGSTERDVRLVRALLDGDTEASSRLGPEEITRIGASVSVPVSPGG